MTPTEGWALAWGVVEGGGPPPGWIDRLVAAYGDPSRHYHDLGHLAECFEHLETARCDLCRPDEVALALWFHDAVYDPRRSDNEARSADWAALAIAEAGGSDALAGLVRRLILATAHREGPEPGDEASLVDVDLAILGSEPDRFDRYEAQVRLEYAWVAEADFRTGRAAVLRRFLGRPSIYSTPRFRDRLESRARGNLGRSLGHLGG